MSEHPGRDAILSLVPPSGGAFWSILDDLIGMVEEERRRVLRHHSEAGLGPDDAPFIPIRERLDKVLDLVTVFEIARELKILNQSDTIPHQDQLIQLFQDSEAFLYYANCYLFFGVRFHAGRIAPASVKKLANLPEMNERPFALELPPDLLHSHHAEQSFALFLDLPDRNSSPSIASALDFLDDYVVNGETKDQFESWLKGLGPVPDESTLQRYIAIVDGLLEWAGARSVFYLSLNPQPKQVLSHLSSLYKFHGGISSEPQGNRGPGGWVVESPIAARIGLADFYWISRLLRADVSADAVVTYTSPSWLELVGLHGALNNNPLRQQLCNEIEEALRSVYDFTCDLIQNSVDVTDENELRKYHPELFADLPETTLTWREAFDEELDEIRTQREKRLYSPPSGPVPPGPAPPNSTKPVSPSPQEKGDKKPKEDKKPVWSRHVREGRRTRDLVGLAFSGGGIRSATFNLGVLQGLQEFDLLRQIDYLSTVSGGGFIGSWLAANVHRTAHWLARLTNWEDSITHLRRYSNYLSPQTGILSADTWTMIAIWIRNAFLVQLTAVTWLSVLLIAALALQPVFQLAGAWTDGSRAIAAFMMGLLLAFLLYNLEVGRDSAGKGAKAKWIQLIAVLPAWIAAFCTAGLLWDDARNIAATTNLETLTYSRIFLSAYARWYGLLACVAIGLFIIAFATISRSSWRDLWKALLHPKTCSLWDRAVESMGSAANAVWITVLSVLALYLQLCAVVWLFLKWSDDPGSFAWVAFVAGPPLVLAANTLSVVLFIGFCGRGSQEWIREWWTRFGTWLGIYGVGYLAITLTAVFGPLWILSLFATHTKIAWGSLATFIATVVGGLFSGNSSKTNGDSAKSGVPWLEWLAKLAGFLFIVGGALAVSTALYALLVNLAAYEPVSKEFYWCALNEMTAINYSIVLLTLMAALALGAIFSWAFEINIFGLNQFYGNRLTRCYLGASRWAPKLRHPQPFTGFDERDDMELGDLRVGQPGDFRGPFPVLNSSLNLGGSSDLSLHTRHSASFSMTPLRCGADRPKVGYAPTRSDAGKFAGGLKLGQAVAISGAAVSPNMGYTTSPLVAFLLTLFNIRLGWWFPNPGDNGWRSHGLKFGLLYLISELFGLADETSAFVNVSDGGHFENLGIYELVRRRCKVIVASDGECDEFLQFGSLGNLVRICDTDFGAKIDIDVTAIRRQQNGESLAHCTVGKIVYSNGSIGYLIYLKASITGDEDVGIAQYRAVHPSFPHETTADQFFSEDQFESYRRLGRHIVQNALRTAQLEELCPIPLAQKLYNVWAPAGFRNEAFLKHSKTLDGLWERFRRSDALQAFFNELVGNPPPPAPNTLSEDVICAGLELIQLMENVFLDLRLDDFWDHPDNRGWTMMFMAWARSPLFRSVWMKTRSTFGIRFGYFCHQRLGLPIDPKLQRS